MIPFPRYFSAAESDVLKAASAADRAVPVELRRFTCRDSYHLYSAEAAYRRSDLFERRRRLMNDWAAYLADKSRDPEAGPVR